MLPALTLPPSLLALLVSFRPLVTAPSFRTSAPWPPGSSPSRGGGRSAGCSPVRGCRGLASPPRSPVLLSCPLERRRPGPGAGEAGGGAAGPRRPAGDRGGRRHAGQAHRQEG